MRKTVVVVILGCAVPAAAQPSLSPADQAAAFTAAGFSRVDGLWRVVLEDAEVGGRQPRRVAPLGVAHRGVHVHAEHGGGLDHLERLQIHVVFDHRLAVGHLHPDAPRLERVLVGPFDGVGRAVGIGGEQRVADVEAHGREGGRDRGHARHDAHAPRQPAAAGGRGDVHRGNAFLGATAQARRAEQHHGSGRGERGGGYPRSLSSTK